MIIFPTNIFTHRKQYRDVYIVFKAYIYLIPSDEDHFR